MKDFLDDIHDSVEYVNYVKVPTWAWHKICRTLERLEWLEQRSEQFDEFINNSLQNSFQLPIAMLAGHALGSGDPESAQMWVDMVDAGLTDATPNQ